jgi:spore germination cell wall hydrolase CwlJ-like protein
MRTIVNIIVAVLALTVPTLGHAEEAETKEVSVASSFINQGRDQIDSLVRTLTQPWVTFPITAQDEECLTRNIYFEAGAENEEGKVAVGIVTVNRVHDGRFGKTICAVVKQRTVTVRSTVIKETEIVHVGWFGRPESITKTHTVINHVPVCQFSWVCAFVRVPRASNPAWEESRRVARELLNNGYEDYRIKYNNALYFHSNGLRPVWTNTMTWIARIGGHTFYTDKH